MEVSIGEKERTSQRMSPTTNVPEFRRVLLSPSLAEGVIHLMEQSFIPFPVDMPVLHCVGNIRCLNQVLNDNSCFSVHSISLISVNMIGIVPFAESSVPPSIPEILELFVDNVCCHDRIYQKRPKPSQLSIAAVDCIP